MIYEKFPEEYNSAKKVLKHEDNLRSCWYQRIRRWCDREGISIRKVNRVADKSPVEVAKLVKRCREDVREVMEAKDLFLFGAGHKKASTNESLPLPESCLRSCNF